MRHAKLRLSVIGLGSKAVADYLPASAYCRFVRLDSVCDRDPQRLADASQTYGVPGFSSIAQLLEERRPDFVLLCLPHDAYFSALQTLTASGVPTLKEKPFATSLDEAARIHQLVAGAGTPLGVTVTRRYHPLYQAFAQLLPRIGEVCTIDVRYTMNVERLDDGWRASKSRAGGGALLDMGYHVVDLLLWYFGLPSAVTARVSAHARPEQRYDVEDTANVQFAYDAREGGAASGHALVSRVFPTKEERVHVIGTQGSLELTREEVRRLDRTGREVEGLTRRGSWQAAATDQIDDFAAYLLGLGGPFSASYERHFHHTAFIEAAYVSAASAQPVSPGALLPDLTSSLASQERAA